MIRLGLIGDPIAHSKSPSLFAQFFAEHHVEGHYDLYPTPTLTKTQLRGLFNRHQLTGINVTVPHKQTVMPFLDRIDPKALRIGAVNTVVKEGETLVGYNTDYYGIRATLEALGAPKDGWKGALVLGNGGAAKAVAAVLTDLSVPYLVVGRATAPWTFETLPKEVAAKYPLWIHCTPVGGPPYLRNILPLPYGVLTKEFAIFDLIYNPEPTALMERAADSGARTIGGRLMLETQAKHAWKLFREAYYKNVDDDERGSTTTA